MTAEICPIIQANELLALAHKKELVIVDASNGPDAKANYTKKHLNGALFADVNAQLSDIKSNAAEGGRHPLPSLEKFAAVLKSLGIDKQSHVVVYDDKNGANAAARFWWMLRSIGHQKVQVLDGGLQYAEKAGFPTNANEVTAKACADYPIEKWNLPLADIHEVEANSQSEKYLVIDVRENFRYRGEREPIDLVAGHIPGAVNIPYTTNLTSEGLFLSPAELKSTYETALNNREPDNVIVHCGSGITACHTLLAMDYAGLEIPRLYVGSWSEWSRNNKPIAVEKVG